MIDNGRGVFLILTTSSLTDPFSYKLTDVLSISKFVFTLFIFIDYFILFKSNWKIASPAQGQNCIIPFIYQTHSSNGVQLNQSCYHCCTNGAQCETSDGLKKCTLGYLFIYLF